MAANVGSFVKSTDAAPVAQAITGVGFTPKALILWTVGATSDNAYAAHIRSAFGVSDGTDSGCVSSAQDDATANTNAARRISTKALCIIDGDGTVLAECTAAFASGKFTLSWSTNNATAYIINYMALGGDALTAAKVLQWTTATSTGDQAITEVGFQPDVVIQLSAALNALDTSAVDAWSSVGFATGSGAAQYFAYWYITDDVTVGYGRSDVGQYLQYGGACKSLDADGYTIAWDTAPAAAYENFTLCLKGGSYKVGWTTKSTSAALPRRQLQGWVLRLNPSCCKWVIPRAISASAPSSARAMVQMSVAGWSRINTTARRLNPKTITVTRKFLCRTIPAPRLRRINLPTRRPIWFSVRRF